MLTRHMKDLLEQLKISSSLLIININVLKERNMFLRCLFCSYSPGSPILSLYSVNPLEGM
jgi:hypothetical protein